MIRRTRFIQILAALSVIACAVAATATSALAISFEPLNTKFEGTSEGGVGVETPGAKWVCEKGTLVGTTNIVKTPWVSATPALSECSTTIILSKFKLTYANSCKKEGTVPWTMTLTEGKGPYTGNTKFNCAFTLNIATGKCVVTVPEQTVAHETRWLSSFTFVLEKIKYKGAGTLCGLFGFGGEGEQENLRLTMAFPYMGIKVT